MDSRDVEEQAKRRVEARTVARSDRQAVDGRAMRVFAQGYLLDGKQVVVSVLKNRGLFATIPCSQC